MLRKPVAIIFGLSFLFSLVLGGLLTYKQQTNQLAQVQSEPQKPQVLGMFGFGGGGYSRSARPGQMYVYGGENSFGTGGIISMSSLDEPILGLSTYNIQGDATVNTYLADRESVIKYAVHNSEGMQVNKQVDKQGFELVETSSYAIRSNNEVNRIPLPLAGKGIWYVSIEVGGFTIDGFIIRSDVGLIAKEGDGRFLFWAQEFDDGLSSSEGKLSLYNLKDNAQVLSTATFDENGIAESDLDKDADIAIYENGDDFSLLPLNLQYLNVGSSYHPFAPSSQLSRYFIFTDRPVYEPGQEVNFKAIIRRDDDARYALPSGQAHVTITTGNNEKKFEKSYPISADGSINGTYKLADDESVGYYNLAVEVGEKAANYNWGEYSSNSTFFNVQHYQKPESFISVDTPKLEYISGDEAVVKISGTYFSGQPLIATDIKYKVTAVDYYEYNLYNDQVGAYQGTLDTFYGNWYGSQKVAEGTVSLDNTGVATVKVDTKQLEEPEENSSYTRGKSKIFVVEATQNDGSLTPSYSTKNFIVYAGDYGIYQNNQSSSGKINVRYTLPLKLAHYFRDVSLAGIDLTARIHRETWVKDDVQNSKYPTYHQEEEDLGEVKMKTNSKGESELAFTPTKLGHYKIRVEGRDKQDNFIAKVFYAYISDRDQPIYMGAESPEISLTLDKDKYRPTDTARLEIVTSTPDRDVLITIERGRLARYLVEHIDGKSKTVELPLASTDVPNVYVTVSSFNPYGLDMAEINLPVSSRGKKLAVTITPDSLKYGPGESASIELATKDQDGNPVMAEVALWAVDKAIFELAATNLGDIFSTFWAERGDTTSDSHSLMGILTQQAEGGGCFAEDTLVTMGNGQTKPIKEVKVGDDVLTRLSDNSGSVVSKVTSLHQAQIAGFMIINQTLWVTPDHILRINNRWQTAGDIQVGDNLTNSQGMDTAVESVEWQQGKFNSYNLEIKDYHTYIANGYWVHNDKGGERSVFKDTAYWNPVIKTDKNGLAKVKFKLPDNLTTWTLAAVASTQDTRVGQSTKEITVNKDIVVRGVTPNILRVGDRAKLSALVQNFTNDPHTFDVQLSFDAGTVAQNTWEKVQIDSQGMVRLSWELSPTQVKDAAKIKVLARATDSLSLSDEITVEIPVRQFGFFERVGLSGLDAQTYQVALDAGADLKQSKSVLSLAPSLLGSLPTAMDYLVNYAYACVEQTVSRLVPSLLISQYPELFTETLKTKEYDKVIDKSLARLATMQRGDGGWTWWFTGKSDPFITTYVLENVQLAQKLGYKVSPQMIERSARYLANSAKDFESELSVSKDPDLLALNVLAASKSGYHDEAKKMLKQLTSLAQSQGDTYFWAAGPKKRFGSIETSTGLALRAMIVAGAERDMIDKTVLYLTRSRKADYWSNTFATSQVLSGLAAYAKLSNDLTPSYTYRVEGDIKQSGTITNSQTIIPDLELDLPKLKDSLDIVINKAGEGNLYSSLVTTQFLTAKNLPSINRGISISKKFENAKGSDVAIGVGDTVNVILTVSGLASDDKYGVIVDELPSGLVPVNTALLNEQSSWNYPEDYEDGFNITDTDVTENGVVLSLYNVASGERTYSYKARAVSAGSYAVPPATVSLMYAPEIHGRTATSELTIADTAGVSSGHLTNKLIINKMYVLFGLIAVVILGIGGYLWFRAKKRHLVLPPPVPPTSNEI